MPRGIKGSGPHGKRTWRRGRRKAHAGAPIATVTFSTEGVSPDKFISLLGAITGMANSAGIPVAGTSALGTAAATPSQ